MSNVQQLSGTVYLGLINPSNGNFLGYLPPMECSAFTPGRAEATVVEVKSAKRAQKGQVIFSQSTQGAPSLEMTFPELDSVLMGMAFAASPETLTVSSGTITNELVTLHALDTWYAISKRTLSSIVVTENTDTTPDTYVLDEDYEVNARLGLIRGLSGGDLTAGQIVRVSATNAAFAGEKYEGELVPQRSFRILFDGRNDVTLKDIIIEYHEVPISAPLEIFDLLSTELITLTLTGAPITPTGKTAPYTVIRQS